MDSEKGDIPKANISKDTIDIVRSADNHDMKTDDFQRTRSGSVGQLFNFEKSSFIRPVNVRRGSLTHLFTSKFDKEHNYFGNVLSDSIDDLDSFSQISDSGFSDVSQSTQSSVNSIIENGMRKNASVSNLLDKESENNKSFKRNLSSADITLGLKGTHIKEKSNQRRLSHSMIWNWVKSQQVKIDEDKSLDICSHSGSDEVHKKDVTSDDHKTTKPKVSMRELNAVGPSGW